MNNYKYQDLKLGQTKGFEYDVTEEKLSMFKCLSGDNNPLHTDDKFAKQHGFSDKVVYGMLTASLISTFGGVYLPGKYCIIQQVEIKFIAPVFVGDRITVLGKIVELNDSVQRAVINIEMRKNNSVKVAKAKLYVGFLE